MLYLKEKKNYFKNYIYDVVVCSNSSTTLGYSYAGDIIQGEAVVVLKDSASGNFSTIKSASSLYGTEDLTLDLKRYVMGAAYGEVGDGVKREAEAKAVMIAAKSFVLGRTGPGSSDVGKGFKPDYSDGKTIFYMRASTADQDFCDVYEGCKSGSRYAKELQKKPTGKSVFILDEPSTGLHIDDIKKLLVILNRIVDNGDTVIVIEHNLDIIKVADYIIDLGPEGGDKGGEIVVCGTPEEVVKCNGSYTGMYLKKYLK